MGLFETTTTNIPTTTSLSSFSCQPSLDFPPSPPPPPPIILSPCAACKILRRKCSKKCILAPYFPPTDPLKFMTAHKVFGASNIIKFLQEIPEPQRADAVSSMVYEASARMRDPVYGCAGAVFKLQKMMIDLQAQLAKTQVELVNMQCQQTNLVDLICMEMERSQQPMSQQPFDNVVISPPNLHANGSFLEYDNVGSQWESL